MNFNNSASDEMEGLINYAKSKYAELYKEYTEVTNQLQKYEDANKQLESNIIFYRTKKAESESYPAEKQKEEQELDQLLAEALKRYNQLNQ